jgi:uncharacterized protein YbcI
MTNPDHEERSAGPRAAAISNMMVQLLHTYTGRGPTRARTTIGDQVVVCVLADTLTKSESKLVAAGEEQLVLDQRSAFQRLMRDDAVAAVEQITGRGVAAFMSNNNIEPDLAVETFVLEPSSDGHLVGEPKHRQAGDQHGRWPE